jgi:hypothetical protein
MSLNLLNLTFLVIVATGALVWLVLRTYDGRRARRSRFIVAIIVAFAGWGLVWPHAIRNPFVSFVLMGLLAPLFRLWPLAIIVLLWLIWKELRNGLYELGESHQCGS